MPNISVIIPVYNVEIYLKQCLDSVINQTLKDIEIICVDDGSTDKSSEILQCYAKKDKRIKVFSQKNQFAGVARNNGMKHATGKYLFFLDADDFMELNMLEIMYRRAEQDQLDITLCHYWHFNDPTQEVIPIDSHKRDAYFPSDRDVFSGKEIRDAGIFQSMVGWAWDKLFRAEFVKEMGYQFPAFRSSEDGFFVYMMVARAKRIGVLQQRLIYHRMMNGSSLSNTREQNWENGFKMTELIYDELVSQNLFELYRKSFRSWVVEFQIWYLTTLYEKDSFNKAYSYIRKVTENKFHILNSDGELICDTKLFNLYQLVMREQPEQFLLTVLKDRDNSNEKNSGKGWIFPYEKIPKGSRIVIYGAGTVGYSYLKQLQATDYCSVVYVVDKNFERYNRKQFPVYPIDAIKEFDYEYILIAISDKNIQSQVKNTLRDNYGIAENRIICGI